MNTIKTDKSPKDKLLDLIHLLGAKITDELLEFLKKYPLPESFPDDSEVKYPCLVAFYRLRPQKKIKKRPNKYFTPKHINNNSIYAALVGSTGNLGSVARIFKHFGYPKMAFSFDVKEEYLPYLEADRIPYFKCQTWQHLKRHINQEEEVFLDELERLYPSHYSGQLTLPI